ncbi:MAG TPA: hypothetical protein VEK79_10540 [Thermoanaerobaculia bacterium]|nr:hypothetical protein [Thermoanaerobaculia bacterium]
MPVSVYRYHDFSYNENAIKGRGIDLITGTPTLDAVQNVNPTSEADPSQTMHSTTVVDQRSFASLLSSVTSAQGSGICFSASGSVAYLQQVAMDQTSLTFILGSTVRTKSDTPDPSGFSLTTEAAAYLRANGPAAFQAKYGTHYVAGYRYGGYFLGTVQIQTQSQSTQTQLQVSVSAAMNEGLSSASFSETLTTGLSTFSSHYSIQASVDSVGALLTPPTTSGSSMANYTGPSPADIGNEFAQFTSAISGGGAPLVAIGYSWDTLSDVNTILGDIGQTGALTLSVDSDVVTTLSAEYAQLAYLMNTATRLIGNNAYAIPHQLQILENVISSASAAQNAIEGLTVEQLSALTSAGAYVKSPDLNGAILPIANGQVALNFTAFLDGAFVTSTNWNQNVAAPFSGNPSWLLDITHSRPQGDDPPQHAQLGYVLDRDGAGPYLQSVFQWTDPYGPGSGTWWGPRIDIEGGGAMTASTASWPPYPWNAITVRVV